MSKIDNLYLYVHFLVFEIFSGIVLVCYATRQNKVQGKILKLKKNEITLLREQMKIINFSYQC